MPPVPLRLKPLADRFDDKVLHLPVLLGTDQPHALPERARDARRQKEEGFGR